MIDSSIFTLSSYIDQFNIFEQTQAIRAIKEVAALDRTMERYIGIQRRLEAIQKFNNSIYDMISELYAPYEEQLSQYKMGKAFNDWKITSIYEEGTSEEDEEEIRKSDTAILSQIYNKDESTRTSEESPIIVLSPINNKVLKYLSENPEAWYLLQDDDFELAMAEIYSKLGYNVERTQSTRDGGKDIIIRKPEILGDFIYYVECKKYAPKRHIGVGIVRNLVGTVNTDRVNGGILATTSFFTRDARKFVLDNKLDFQIKMHDYNKIQQLLNGVV